MMVLILDKFMQILERIQCLLFCFIWSVHIVNISALAPSSSNSIETFYQSMYIASTLTHPSNLSKYEQSSSWICCNECNVTYMLTLILTWIWIYGHILGGGGIMGGGGSQISNPIIFSMLIRDCVIVNINQLAKSCLDICNQ